jgi:hypothetical protein
MIELTAQVRAELRRILDLFISDIAERVLRSGRFRAEGFLENRGAENPSV